MNIFEAKTYQFKDKIAQLPYRPEGNLDALIDPAPVINLAEEFYKFAVATLVDNPIFSQLHKDKQTQIEWNITILDSFFNSYVEQNLCKQITGHSEFENIAENIASDSFLSKTSGYKEFKATLNKLDKAAAV